MKTPVLLLPGWQDSGPDHWQSLWEKAHGYLRVEQHDWMRPLRGDWIARLEEMLLSCATPSNAAVLVGHSLGCVMAAAWAAHTRNPRLVRAALLVAPGDVERPDVRELLPTWSPIPKRLLPFPSMLLASRDDPYCEFEKARSLALAWGSNLVDCGASGHINADSGLGDWPLGHALLRQLIEGR
jgi:predicted alpha/beta hydrolase family esterase